jgi:hypothetical protein
MGFMRGTFALLLCLLTPFCLADQSVYSEQLDNTWQNWSWATVNTSNPSPTHGGVRSISVTATGSGQALYLHHNAQSAVGYQSLTFWINGGATGGQLLQVQGTLDGGYLYAYPIPALAANTWTKVVVPLKGLGVKNANNFDGFWIQDRSGTTQPTYYVDDVSLASETAPPPSSLVFDDTLQNSWQNWSWATVNLTNTNPVHGGTMSASVHEVNAYDGFYVHHANLDSSLYKTLSFWINGGATGGQQLQVYATASGVGQVSYSLPTLPANIWTQVTIPLSSLGMLARGDFDGFFIQSRVNAPQATYYVDDLTVSTLPVVNAPSIVTIDPSLKYDISPLIYGANSTDYAGMGGGFKFARQGGNRMTAYNWENNASNAGSDYYFQNDGYLGATNEPGWTMRTFVQAATAGGAIPLVTIPCAGYVSADKNGGGDVRNSPDYLNTRFKVSLPAKPGGSFVYPPDITDAFVYQDECVNYIKQFAQPGLPIMFSLDNEPDLWSSTHAEIHPNAATYAEMVTRSTDYAKAIKNAYPTALVFGPVNYGWNGFTTLQGAPDAGGRNFIDTYLDGMRIAHKAAGKRLVDALDVHWYPEAYGDNTRIVSDGDTQGLSEARIQASRSLWDSTYVENSWITSSLGNQPISLLPWLSGKIRAHYAGTKLAITEYNYGGSNAISGAIAQADVLGLFGRNGVYASANWGLYAGAKAQLAGFKSFINYDRAGSKFGDQGLFVTGEKASENSVYAAADSTVPGRYTIVVINKTVGVTPFKLLMSGFLIRSSKAYAIVEGQYDTPFITGASSSGDTVKFSAPPQSVTTIQVIATMKK